MLLETNMQKAKDLLKILGLYEFGQETRREAEWGRLCRLLTHARPS